MSKLIEPALAVSTVIDFMSDATDILLQIAVDINEESIVNAVRDQFEVEATLLTDIVLNRYVDASMKAAGFDATSYIRFRVLFVEGTRFFIEALAYD